MAKYKVGDRVIATITAVDDSGMGTIYRLNDILFADTHQLDEMEIEEPTLLEPVSSLTEEKKTYTPEDLLERISRANVILNELIKTYVEMAQTVNHIPAIDERLEELSL